jgi:16S rRNA (adenine1518-N6/adenine1519-N6)-dimethyltransferase
VVKLLFSQRRKTLLNGLRPLAAARGLDAGTLLAAIGIDARRRPETLDLEEFAAIAELLAVPPASAVL